MNRVVVVAGGTTGIGRCVADKFEKNGDNVYSFGRKTCDVTDKNQIDSYFEKFTKIDVLINCVAINYPHKLHEISFDEWQKVISTNLTSYFYLIKKTIKKMPKNSKIVNVSSIAGRHKSICSGAHYTSSKAGIIGLTRQLAQELGPLGININCVCPSQTLTPMLKRTMSEDEMELLQKNIPLRRIASVEEITEPIFFLCSKESSYIHGACIDINGGQF